VSQYEYDYDYRASERITAFPAPPFSALIMAALRRAGTDNYRRLAAAFPAIEQELRQRYNAPGGLLPHETEEARHGR
jgi:hypothetical protein